MELVWLVYFISMLDSIGPALVMILVSLGIVIPLIVLIRQIEFTPRGYDSKMEQESRATTFNSLGKFIKTGTITFIVCGLLVIIIPSKKTAYIMVGAYVAQKIAESGEVKEVGSKVYAIINKQLDSYLAEEIDPKAKK